MLRMPSHYDTEWQWLFLYIIQGGLIKTERHTSHNYGMQYLVLEDDVSSPENSDTKISKFGSVNCFLGPILWDNVEAQHFPFSAEASRERISFSPAIVVSSNPINSQYAFYTSNPSVKLNWLPLTNVASRNGIYSSLVLAEKESFYIWTSTSSHKMCPRKPNTEPKLLILVSFFLSQGKIYLIHLYQLLHPLKIGLRERERGSWV